ncbi:hypothetical protein C8R45DRAFT_932670 [Mycena sanguinolenta]|nr:hypothetical protein C8R45DRAFT_932670 [Mycena sanguinolenta]
MRLATLNWEKDRRARDRPATANIGSQEPRLHQRKQLDRMNSRRADNLFKDPGNGWTTHHYHYLLEYRRTERWGALGPWNNTSHAFHRRAPKEGGGRLIGGGTSDGTHNAWTWLLTRHRYFRPLAPPIDIPEKVNFGAANCSGFFLSYNNVSRLGEVPPHSRPRQAPKLKTSIRASSLEPILRGISDVLSSRATYGLPEGHGWISGPVVWPVSGSANQMMAASHCLLPTAQSVLLVALLCSLGDAAANAR